MTNGHNYYCVKSAYRRFVSYTYLRILYYITNIIVLQQNNPRKTHFLKSILCRAEYLITELFFEYRRDDGNCSLHVLYSV